MRKSANAWHNWLLLLGVVVLAIAPLCILPKAEFSGSDGEAETAIGEIRPDYQPWFQPLLEPASGEIESLLFALQAALGAGTIGFIMGLYRGREQTRQPLSSLPAANHDTKD